MTQENEKSTGIVTAKNGEEKKRRWTPRAKKPAAAPAPAANLDDAIARVTLRSEEDPAVDTETGDAISLDAAIAKATLQAPSRKKSDKQARPQEENKAAKAKQPAREQAGAGQNAGGKQGAGQKKPATQKNNNKPGNDTKTQKNAQPRKNAQSQPNGRSGRGKGQSPASAAAGAASQAQPVPAGQRVAADTSRRPLVPLGKSPSIEVIPLGGLGEVGKNATVLSCGNDMILVDCGVVFPDVDMFGVDLVIPDFTFIVQNREKFRGVLITHGHEDHIGALPYLLKQVNLPVYATRLTVGFIENKLREHGLLDSTRLYVIEPNQKLKFGCMTVEPIHVNHSMPDAVAFAVDSPAGVVIMTGDFKIDYTPISGGVTDLATFAEYGRRGVLALLSDSTNAERPGFSRSERTVGESFAGLFAKAEGKRIIIATFASSLYRVQQILDMAVKYGRKVVFSGRSMVNNSAMAFELGYLLAPQGLVVDVEDLGRYDPENVVIITTGSQGEPLAALSRMAAAMHRQVHIGADDFIIISANPIPGNEKSVGKVVNSLLRLGAEVIYESMYDVHVSGHAYQDEQKLLLSLVNPRYFMPVHGEYKHLYKHAGLAESVGMPREDIFIADIGEVYSFSETKAGKVSQVQAGRVLVDGIGVGDVGTVVLRDRHHLAQDGLVIVVATMDGTTGELLSGPDLVSRGFVYVKEADALLKEARGEVMNVLSRQRRGTDSAELKSQVREALGNFIFRKTKRSPMILPILMEV